MTISTDLASRMCDIENIIRFPIFQKIINIIIIYDFRKNNKHSHCVVIIDF